MTTQQMIRGWRATGTRFTDAVTSAEALAAAELDWKVTKEPVAFKTADGWKPVAGQFATVRQDTKAALGVVGDRYTVLQNAEAFSFADAILGIKGANVDSAGSFRGGRRVWLSLKLAGVVKVIGEDTIEKFLLVANSHDGSSSVDVLLTPNRIACENSLNGAIRYAAKNGDLFRMRHTPGMGAKVEAAQKELGIISAKFDIFGDMARKLAATQLTGEASKAYFVKAANRYGVAAENVDELPAKTKAIIEKLSELFEIGRGQELRGAKGTLWGAYNAVTEFVDHYRGTTGEGDEMASNRANAALFGTGAAMKERAWMDALQIAGVPSFDR